MNPGWKHTTLGDSTELLTGFPFRSANYTSDPTGIPLIRGDNIVQGDLRWSNVKRWPADQVSDVTNYLLKENDVVVAMDRPWIEAGLKYACISKGDLPCLLVQRVARLRSNETMDQGYLRYLIASQEFTNHVVNVQTGTAVPHISGSQILSFKFSLPPLPKQKRIAHILGALDDKIELNRRMNETLEQMARALFKSWFVDFDPVRYKMEGRDPCAPVSEGGLGLDLETAALFPDKLVPSPLGMIPEGWEVKPLDSIARFLNGLALQKYPVADENDEYLPAIKIAELRNGVTANSGKASLDVPQQYVIKDGDFLFSWSGSLLAKIWTGGSGALNQHLFKVTANEYPQWFYYHWVQQHLPWFQFVAASKATTMGHIQRQHLTEAEVVVPIEATLKLGNEFIQPLLGLVVSNNLESRVLTELRDYLLPKLISGQISTPISKFVVQG